MKMKSSLPIISFIALVLLIAPGFTAAAAGPVAKVASFKGEADIQSGTTAIKVSQVGQAVLDGDLIQTKDGEVQLAFTDGAVMTINPFSTTMIQEREEESGFLVKTKKSVRRLTAFVGKSYFKSGSSERENFLQTPTAVCGLRGSAAEFGFDNITSLLNLITGAINAYGSAWKQGAFNNPGSLSASQNAVYRKLANTVAQIEKARQTGAGNDQTLATLNAYELMKLVGEELAKNPDPTIRQVGQGFIARGDQGIANVRTTVFTSVLTTSTSSTTTTIPPTTTPTTAPTTSTIYPTTTTTPTTAPTTSTTSVHPPYPSY